MTQEQLIRVIAKDICSGNSVCTCKEKARYLRACGLNDKQIKLVVKGGTR